MSSLTWLLAHQACRDLVVQAARAVDGQDYPAFAALFTQNGVLLRPGAEPLQGHEAIIAAYSQRPAERITRHLVTDSLISVQSDHQAMVHSSVLLWSGRRSDASGAFGRPADARQVVGEFEDICTLTAVGWRIARRDSRFLLYREN